METNSEADLRTVTAGRHYVITVDGSCLGNPGAGGWGIVKQLKQGGKVLRQAAYAAHSEELSTTNNRMELTAAAIAAERMMETDTPAILRTDAAYVMKGMTEWLPKWKQNGWRTADRGWVLSHDLWERLDAACDGKTILWEKVKGHSGDTLNELADMLARNAAGGMYRKRSVKTLHPELFLSGEIARVANNAP
ncbi:MULTISPECIES: ribonuclease H [unclassified Pannonibacter]|uniref:ribonuclease H family protein n=1 Tax=unclassified Pannonibacter TaxID=2627228 RepID=UPI0016485616|nr:MULTISPECIES: ribonuclease H [unclassified Pannonibacter]